MFEETMIVHNLTVPNKGLCKRDIKYKRDIDMIYAHRDSSEPDI